MVKYVEQITLLGVEWLIYFNYEKGTNFVITSASLEPNDPDIIEIESIEPMDFSLPKEFDLEGLTCQFEDVILGQLNKRINNE